MRNSTPVYFPKTTRIKEEISQIGAKAAKDLYHVNDLVSYLNEVFRKEYSQYFSKGEYFPGCPFDLYKKHYKSRLQEYRNTYPDAKDEFYFLEQEDIKTSALLQMRKGNKSNFYNFYSVLDRNPHQKNFELSLEKTLKFIHWKAEDLGHFRIIPGYSLEDMSDPAMWEHPLSCYHLERNPKAEDQGKILLSEIEVATKEVVIPEDAKFFDTVWEAVLYHSVLVNKYPKKYQRSKKDLPELTSKMFLPTGKPISHNSFYNKLLVINDARNGVKTKEGRYTPNDYEAVENRFKKEDPEALFKLREEYFYKELY